MSALQDALFTAAANGDADELESLCRTYLPLVLAEFPTWTTVPEEWRSDDDSVSLWAAVVLRIAQELDRQGHPEPLERMTGGADNPIVRWQRALSRAQALNGAGHRDDAAELVLAVLADMDGARGSALTELRPKAIGLLGTIYFHQGDPAGARRYTALALDECRRHGDLDGVRIYSENLAALDAVEFGGAAADRRTRVSRAQDLSDAARYRASNALIEEVLDDLDDRDPLHPKACGLLGLNLYRLADLAGARRWTEQALQECRRLGDEFGITIYSANLETIDRAAEEATTSPE